MTTDQPVRARVSRALAPALFLAGVLWLAVMAFAAAWPDMEATVFDATTALAAKDRLRSLDCPWLMTADESTTVRATFTNDADRPASFLVRARTTRGFVTLVHEHSQQVTLAPNESRVLSWPVSAADAAYGRLVMARVLATRSAVGPARENACGILVVGVSGVGGQLLFVAGTLFGLALVGIGAGAWWSNHRPLGARDRRTARRAGVLAGTVIASLVTGMLGLWLISHALLVATFLVSLVLLEASVSD